MTVFSDTVLRAYLDGALDADQAANIDAALATDDDLARRMMALDDVAGAVQSAFQKLQPAPQSIAHKDKRGVNWAVIAATIVVGVGLGWGLKPAPDSGWMAKVAAYQALYVPATVSADTDAANQSVQLDRVGAAIGIDFDGIDTAVPELTFVRAQILGDGDQTIAQLVFRNDAGTPVALCLIENGDGPQATLTFKKMRGLSSLSWANATHQMLLIGGKTPGVLDDAAYRFQSHLGIS